jgi:hypothetical protein
VHPGILRTDGDGLDLDAFLDMGSAGVVGLLVRENGLAAESVDEGGPACRSKQRLVGGCAVLRGSAGIDSPVPEAPQTIRQNWIPFFTFFLRRIIFCAVNMLASLSGLNTESVGERSDGRVSRRDAAEKGGKLD